MLAATALTVAAPLALASCADGPPPIRRAGEVTTTTIDPAADRIDAAGQPNDLYPETRNRSECGPAVERPGCGSKAKGNWRMKLVFGVLAAGLIVIGWRVAHAARRRTAALGGDQPRGDWA